jgi:hypothetical protein
MTLHDLREKEKGSTNRTHECYLIYDAVHPHQTKTNQTDLAGCNIA